MAAAVFWVVSANRIGPEDHDDVAGCVVAGDGGVGQRLEERLRDQQVGGQVSIG